MPMYFLKNPLMVFLVVKWQKWDHFHMPNLQKNPFLNSIKNQNSNPFIILKKNLTKMKNIIIE